MENKYDEQMDSQNVVRAVDRLRLVLCEIRDILKYPKIELQVSDSIPSPGGIPDSTGSPDPNVVPVGETAKEFDWNSTRRTDNQNPLDDYSSK